MSKKKIAYDNKRVFKKTTISKEKYDSISSQSSASAEILSSERFEFFRELLLGAKKYASTSIIENTIKDVREEVSISDKLKKTFFTPKKIQVDELSGQYKLISKIFEDLQYFVDLKLSVDQHIADDKVTVDAK